MYMLLHLVAKSELNTLKKLPVFIQSMNRMNLLLIMRIDCNFE